MSEQDIEGQKLEHSSQAMRSRGRSMGHWQRQILRDVQLQTARKGQAGPFSELSVEEDGKALMICCCRTVV